MPDESLSIDDPRSHHARRVLRRSWWIVALTGLAGLAGALAYTTQQADKFEASATILFRQANVDQQLLGFQAAPRSQDPSRDAATNLGLVTQPVVVDRAAAALGRGLSAADVRDAVTAEPVGASDVVRISAVDGSPERAAAIATTYARVFAAYRREVDANRIRAALRTVEAALAAQRKSSSVRESDLAIAQERVDQLRTLVALQTGNVEILAAARVPQARASPQPKKAGVIGLVFGLLAGVALTLVRERFDQKVRSPEQASELLGLPILAELPVHESIQSRDPQSVLAPEVADHFRLLRSRIQYWNVDTPVRSVVLTSSNAGDGKSTIAWHLACATAEITDGRVILVEADLRRPTLAAASGLRASPGLADVVAGSASLDDAIQRVDLGIGNTAVYVLTAGSALAPSNQIVNSDRFKGVVKTLHNDFNALVFDAPPATFVPDAIPLLPLVDGVIAVSRLTHDRRDATAALREQFQRAGIEPLGVVVNAATPTAGTYEYYGQSAS